MYEAIIGKGAGAKGGKEVLRLLLEPDALERTNKRLNSMTSDSTRTSEEVSVLAGLD
jgi:hypothetical protein